MTLSAAAAIGLAKAMRSARLDDYTEAEKLDTKARLRSAHEALSSGDIWGAHLALKGLSRDNERAVAAAKIVDILCEFVLWGD